MIKLIERYNLEMSSIPYSDRDDEVVYVESRFNPDINRFIQEHLGEIEGIFRNELLRFKYVPESSARTIDGSEIDPSVVCNKRRTRQGDTPVFEAYHLDISWIKDEYQMLQQFKDVAKAYSRRESIDYKQIARDEETTKMLYEMERLARALKLKGVKPQVFDDMLASIEKPTKIVFNRFGHIVFPDFGGMKVMLNPMEKTLYAFFLNHPSGILADELIGYRRELLELYEHASVYDEWERAENAIDALCEESKKTFYTNVSRIKSKIKGKLGDRISEHYAIRKAEDGRYRVSIPEEMVDFESERWKIRH